MKKLTLKGIDPKIFNKLIMKTALIRDKKGDKSYANALPLYLFGDKLSSVKQNGSKTTVKYWYEELSNIIDNSDDIYNKIKDNMCRIWLFDIITLNKILKGFKDKKINIEITINDNYDSCGLFIIRGEKTSFKFSLAEPNSVFENIKGGWEQLEDTFSVENSITSFSISKKEIQTIKALSKIETVIDKSHDSITLFTNNGILYAKTHSSEFELHPSTIELSNINIKRDVVNMICVEDYNVYIKKIGNGVDVLLLDSLETKTKQTIALLTQFNSNIDLKTVDEEIENIDYDTWLKEGDDEELF